MSSRSWTEVFELRMGRRRLGIAELKPDGLEEPVDDILQGRV
jgi:hypothetical protein